VAIESGRAIMRSMSSLKGRLLVATPVIGDPNFDRTVLLVLEHSDDGALGLVLNRPTEVAVLDPLPEWDDLVAAPSVVFVGGPVEQEAAIGLARLSPRVEASASVFDEVWSDGSSLVVGHIGTLDLSRSPDDLDVGIEEVRVFAGYAGWGPGQLEGELDVDAWLVVEPQVDDILSREPSRLWSDVLRRQGGDLTLLSYCPPDPSAN
jgi:putative transcriptional regulator